jgi:hypothetical protein
MCPQREERKQLKPDMSLGQVNNLLTKLKNDLDLKSISLIGGEVLVRSDVLDILKKLEELRIKVFISSNGTLIDEKMAIALKKVRILLAWLFLWMVLRISIIRLEAKIMPLMVLKERFYCLKMIIP